MANNNNNNYGNEARAREGVPEAVAEPKLISPSSMYQICLKAFVRTRKNPELRLIRFLPPSVISEILAEVGHLTRTSGGPLTFTLILVACTSWQLCLCVCMHSAALRCFGLRG